MRVYLLVATLLLFAGCGGTTSPATAPQTPTGSVSSTVGAEPQKLSVDGIDVQFEAAALSQETLVMLETVAEPPAQPPNAEYVAEGRFLEVDLGSATVQGRVRFSFPSNGEVWGYDEGLYFPLEQEGPGVASLTFSPGDDDFLVGVMKPPQQVPHVAWGSWNGYVFNPSSGTFEPVIRQGQAVGPLPELGDRPLMIVHGLGSSIQGKTFDPVARYLWDQGAATSILGFEYDTLDAVQTNGTFLRQALTQLGATASWNVVAHSMGTLVTRSAIEQPGPLGTTGNRAVLLCGPHRGSLMIDRLQARDSMGLLLSILGARGVMEFRNSDGRLCKVENREPGLDDLRDDSPYLAALNAHAADNHPGVAYFTLAGGVRRQLLDTAAGLVESIVGKRLDDGVVDIASANFPGIGQQEASILEFDHLTVNNEDSATSFPAILRSLQVPVP